MSIKQGLLFPKVCLPKTDGFVWNCKETVAYRSKIEYSALLKTCISMSVGSTQMDSNLLNRSTHELCPHYQGGQLESIGYDCVFILQRRNRGRYQ